LLDTNIIIALFAGEGLIKERLAQVEEVFTSPVVLGELYYGAHKSRQTRRNIAKIDALALKGAILPCDWDTARRYGVIKNHLRIKGSPIPENDIWIAASAMQHDLILITRDDHFTEIEHLTLEMW